MVADKGAGPKGINIGKITTANLEPKILDLLNEGSYKTAAAQIASQMGAEDFKVAIHKAIVEV